MKARTCKMFQRKMEKLAKIAGIDIYEGSGAFVRARVSDAIMPLSIENIGLSRIAVHHTYVQNGDLMMDPEVVFLVTDEGWAPMEYQQDNLAIRQVVAKSIDGKITHLAPRQQADLVRFCNQWARTLEMQGFFEPMDVTIEETQRSYAWQEKQWAKEHPEGMLGAGDPAEPDTIPEHAAIL